MDETASTAEAASWLGRLSDALSADDPGAAAAMFGDDCSWRDLLAFTWNIVTVDGRGPIAAMLADTLPRVRPRRFEISGQATAADGVVSAQFTFETGATRGWGLARLRDGVGCTMFTAMLELKGFEERRGATRALGVDYGAIRGRRTWLDSRQKDAEELGIIRQPYCLIIGGGQGGMALGARLKQLGVPALIIDRNERPGDAWRNRYKSLCLHDAVWYDHMPYLPFPEHWPVFTPKDKMGDWLEAYASLMELDYWSKANCVSARYDASAGRWSVDIDRDGINTTVQAEHLVLATGMSGLPAIPDLPGAGTFKGHQYHSSVHRSGEAFAGKKCVVVGSNNSAHDIAADLWEHEAEVTMIQRSSTLVAKAQTLSAVGAGARALYSQAAADAGVTTERADLIAASLPHRLQPEAQIPVYREIQARDAVFYDRLRAAGFLLDFGEDGSGIAVKYARRGSGYYIDVGASELIADGRVALRSGVHVALVKERSVVLSDGLELPADLIVYATGYGPMNGWMAQIMSQDVADRVGRCWGLGSGTAMDPGPWEGELRNMWKPTAQEGLWFHGGSLAQSRHYSRYLSLQLKARMEGLPLQVYGMGPVHHRH